ncbi:MAG: bifunctional phosphoribosylaminoimidazolecarboxamide formyltransferase/IMP cyclohydrolase [Candidatus Aureabacteria bacterium]|nr:bifunctional phosphoribosylaminoimidazolecarboxamide formyltransferase/IMP cyclohydrolase [Candidatus Auribacterota bacterium]
MSKIQRALVSVSDKTGIVEMAKFLSEKGVELISTGGTYKLLKEKGIEVKEISEYTGFPEMMDGRVKTLHPKVHGGLLALRKNKEHVRQMKDNDILPIDMVVVNLYPFKQASKDPGKPFQDVIENIDIGGPSMLRSGSKNFESVVVVSSPGQYEIIKKEINETGDVSYKTRKKLARDVFCQTASYDAAISAFLSENINGGDAAFPGEITFSGDKVQDLRYGENPHQKAAYYSDGMRWTAEPPLLEARQIHGKELSFNNIIDFDGALDLVKEFSKSAVVVVKHTNPCGVAEGDESLLDIFKKAWATDPVSAFGSVIAVNTCVDEKTAEEIAKYFVEGVIAPGFDEKALPVLTKKKNLRLLELKGLDDWCRKKRTRERSLDIKKVSGGLLVQERNIEIGFEENYKVVTERKPSRDEREALFFAWKVVKHVKSNAIVYAKKGEAVGIGAGQMSRVDSSKIAIMKAQKDIKGSVLASDAFFPFRDGVDTAAEAGVTAIIQPGGSVRDQEVIDACNEHAIAMLFTGMRHFRH